MVYLLQNLKPVSRQKKEVAKIKNIGVIEGVIVDTIDECLQQFRPAINTVYGNEQEVLDAVGTVDSSVKFSRAIEQAWVELQEPEKVAKVDMVVTMANGNTHKLTVVKKSEQQPDYHDFDGDSN